MKRKTQPWATAVNGVLVLNLKSAEEITDRAKRYRANVDGFRPPKPKRCGYCGSMRNVGVDHIDGNESHGEPRNLMWACKSCNAKKANVFKRAKIGKLTRQMNRPRRHNASKSALKAYGDAIKVMRGQFDGDVSAAVRTIQETPHNVRSEYNRIAWKARKQIYGPSGRQTEIPF